MAAGWTTRQWPYREPGEPEAGGQEGASGAGVAGTGSQETEREARRTHREPGARNRGQAAGNGSWGY